MTRVNNHPLLIEFVPGTRISREPEIVSKLPISPSTGKLLANMQRSTPRMRIASRTIGAFF